MSQVSEARKLTKHSIEQITSPNSDGENGSDGGPPASPKQLKEKEKDHSEKVVSYTEMIAKAIFASPNNMSTLADIYSYLIAKYPILKSRGKSWKNSVRHTLSLNEWFIKIPKLDNAKCCYWSIHPIYIQRFRRGDFQKQRKASATKLRSHHNSRYFDFGYDISPTLDYHFLPPPPHFHDMAGSGLSPHAASAFSPWPISRSFEEFPPNFIPPVGPQYPPYPMYNNAPTVPSFPPYYPSEQENGYYRQEPHMYDPPPLKQHHQIHNGEEQHGAMYNKHYNVQPEQQAEKQEIKSEPHENHPAGCRV